MFEERKKDSLIKDIYRITVSYPNVMKKYRKFLYSGNISLNQLAWLKMIREKLLSIQNLTYLERKLYNRVQPQSKISKSGIYKLNCQDCVKSYVGPTVRNLE